MSDFLRPHGISQARILELVAISFSKGFFQPMDQTHISSLAGGFFTTEPSGKPLILCFSSVQFSSSVTSDSLRPHGLQHARPPCPSSTPGIYSLMSIESVMLCNHLILYYPLLLLASIFPSIRVFSNELVLHIRWPEYWSFRFSISLSNEYSGLISFRTD